MTLYLDAAATTPVRREALEAMWPYLTGDFGNPSSTHELGERAAAGLADARARVAAVLGCRASEVTFTSGGTEGANLAIKGLALGLPRGRHVVTSPIEHEAVLASAEHLTRWHGFATATTAVDHDGVVTPDALTSALREDTTLVSIGYANNEVGTVQDIAALAAAAREHGALVHTDAVQAAGWLPLDVSALNVDALSISGHKVGAPKGIGAVFLRGRHAVIPVIDGGGQERERRSGTENVAGAVALATALELAEAERVAAAEQVAGLRDRLVTRVLTEIPTALLTGSAASRLPGHASFCFPGTSGEAVLLELERRGVLVSSGSACAAGRDVPSHVLVALGLEPGIAQTAVRLTMPATLTAAEVDLAATAIVDAVTALALLPR
ncbi:cysteine desulfurase family protein [Pseudactinotalea sp.]|uniref:cysteine desulfurase family protein n=1 Tax=Pseudactinotalea sp. TaxID=1926260 RepID=UPI003B3B5667